MPFGFHAAESHLWLTIDMTRIIPSVLLIAITFYHCNAQELSGDSLAQKLQLYRQEDSAKINLMVRYGYYLAPEHPDSAYVLADESIQLSKKLNWNIGEASGLLLLSVLRADELKFDTAVSLSMQALTIAESANHNKTAATAHRYLSEFYRMLKNDSLNVYHGKKCLEQATIAKDEKMILDALLLLYNLYSENGNKTETEKYYRLAMSSAVVQNNEPVMARVFEIQAYLQFQEKEFIKSLSDYRQAFFLYRKLNGYPYLAYVETQLSRVFSILKNNDSAVFYAALALDLTTKYNLKKEKIDVYETLFNNAYESGDYKKAVIYRLIYDSLQDNMNRDEMSRNVERSRMREEQKKKDIQLQAEQEKKDAVAKRKRNLQLVIVIFTLVVAAFLFWNNRQKQKAKEKIEMAYTQLQSAQAQLIQSEKMASLGQVTAGIAHEIQNPLNFVNNFSEVNGELISELKGELASDSYRNGNSQNVMDIIDDINQNLTKINHHGKRADAIVKGMLEHSRQGTGQKQLTDINALADEYLKLAYHGLRAKDKDPIAIGFNSTMKTDFDKSIGKVKIVAQDMGRVLLNLYNNAFYAVKEKMAESRKLPGASFEPVVMVTTKKEGNKIIITVTDNGNGIPQSIVDKIFQPFFTTKPTGQGTGLGLSLSYDIVKAHGGEILVKTKVGEGSMFIIQIPCSINP